MIEVRWHSIGAERVFAKVCIVILSIGAIGCSLLAMRQGRLQAASELTQAQLRITKLDHRLWDLRARVAAGTTPLEVERMAAALGPMRPLSGETAEEEASVSRGSDVAPLIANGRRAGVGR